MNILSASGYSEWDVIGNSNNYGIQMSIWIYIYRHKTHPYYVHNTSWTKCITVTCLFSNANLLCKFNWNSSRIHK